VRPIRLRFTCARKSFTGFGSSRLCVQETGHRPAKCPEPLCLHKLLASAARRLAPRRRGLPLLHRSYGLMRQTIALLRPRFVSLVPQVFAGCCQPLLGNGPSRHYLCNPCVGAWTPAPLCLSGALARFFPESIGLTLDVRRSARQFPPGNATSTG
jgi:hypothetical protein